MNWQKRLVNISLIITALVIPTTSPATPTLTLVTTRIPLAKQNLPYTFKLYASGGNAPYIWTVSGLSGSGLDAGSDGIISGTPSNIASYNLNVTVEDSSNPPLKANGSLVLSTYDGGFPGAVSQSFFGLHAHNPNSEWPAVSSQTNPFGVVRLWDTGTSWSNMERTQGNINWSLLDPYVKVAQGNGVDVLYEVALTPTWASSDPTDTSCRDVPGSCDAPADWQTFDDFVTAVVSRYKSTGVQAGCPTTDPQCHGVIGTYELWNEVFNPRMWQPKQKAYNYDSNLTMQGFVKLTRDAQRIIKSIDAAALVSSPSTSPSFMTQYWATPGALTNFDMIALHAYPMPTHPAPESMIFPTLQMRRLMASYQVTSPLMNTEGSWSTLTPPTNDAQAAYAARFILLQLAVQMEKFMWYLWTGMAQLWNGALTPAGQGYQQVSTWLLGARMDSSGCLDSSGMFQPDIYKCYKLDGTYVVNLSRPNNYVGQAVWYVKTTPSGVDWTATSTYNVPSDFVQYRDLNGNVYDVVNSKVTVGASPLLLETKSSNNQTRTATTVVSSGTPMSFGTPVTFTATVTSSAGTPIGTVKFLDGTTALGDSALDGSGVATFTISTLAVGTHSITATYSGSANFSSSTSSTLNQVIQGANGQDFGLSVTPSSMTAHAGAPALFTITATGQKGFNSAVTLACTSGLPSHASCEFSPSTITPGTNPASATVTINTTKPMAALKPSSFGGRGGQRMYAMWLAIPAVLMGTVGLAAPKRRKLLSFCLAFLVLGGCLFQSSCSGVSAGSSTGGTQPGTYKIVITGTAGATQHTAKLELTVQ